MGINKIQVVDQSTNPPPLELPPDASILVLPEADCRRHYMLFTNSAGRVTKSWMCGICGKEFPKQYALMRHLRMRHLNVRLFRCGTCDKAFKTRMVLMRHCACHSTLRPYVCGVLPEALQPGNGARPARARAPRHTSRFACHCGKRFHQKANLVVHQRTHQNLSKMSAASKLASSRPASPPHHPIFKCFNCDSELDSLQAFRDHQQRCTPLLPALPPRSQNNTPDTNHCLNSGGQEDLPGGLLRRLLSLGEGLEGRRPASPAAELALQPLPPPPPPPPPSPALGRVQTGLPVGQLQAGLPLGRLQTGPPLGQQQAGLPLGQLQAALPLEQLRAGLPLGHLPAALPLEQLQTGLSLGQLQVGPEQLEQLQTGPEQLLTGPGQLLTGPKQLQTGPALEQLQTDSLLVQLSPQPTPVPAAAQQEMSKLRQLLIPATTEDLRHLQRQQGGGGPGHDRVDVPVVAVVTQYHSSDGTHLHVQPPSSERPDCSEVAVSRIEVPLTDDGPPPASCRREQLLSMPTSAELLSTEADGPANAADDGPGRAVPPPSVADMLSRGADRTAGTDGRPRATEALARGADALAGEAGVVPTDAEVLPKEAGLLPGGLQLQLPTELDALPRGSDTLPAGVDAPPLGGDMLPRGADSLPAGADMPLLGADMLRRGADSLPAGPDMLPLGADMLLLRADMLPRGSAILAEEAAVLAGAAEGQSDGADLLSAGADTMVQFVRETPSGGFEAVSVAEAALLFSQPGSSYQILPGEDRHSPSVAPLSR
ncbi:zinc finger protein 628-like [Pollicipes pollicipes]|uniref:zinc finger protein 628-like n=1 Tax=Pollicipes pollicipes TaxID=41117 RepID=UPI0018855FDA|nr:zinc finger protein 628-like [Pollicipes pollicipes]